MAQTADSLNFKEISNYLFFSEPCNCEVASTYVQQKILDMARVFPEIRDDPFSIETVDLCVTGEYDPLHLVELLENFVEQTRDSMMEKCPSKSWEEIKAGVVKHLNNRYFMMDAPENIKDGLIFMDKFFPIYDAVLEKGIAMRNEYARIVVASQLIGRKREMFPIEALLEPETRDEITTLAFQDREMAEDCFEKLFFHYSLIKLLHPLGQYVNTNISPGEEFVGLLDSVPVAQIDKLQEKTIAFAVMEADRLYGRDSSF